MEGYRKESRRIVRSEIEKERLEADEELRIRWEKELERNTFYGQGSFFVKHNKPTAILLLSAAGASAIYGLFVAVMLILWLFDGMMNFSGMGISVGMAIVSFILAGFLFNLYRRGSERLYKADGREFTVRCKDENKPVDHIFYKDVEDVIYKPTKFLWIPLGYSVSVKMKSGFRYRYDYVFPGNGKVQRTKNLPFEIIREQINSDKENR